MRLIVTDGVFSMDGNVAPLRAIGQLADQYNAMIFIDECHATGFFGPTGRCLSTCTAGMTDVRLISFALLEGRKSTLDYRNERTSSIRRWAKPWEGRQEATRPVPEN